jgi:hypothetical protein
MKIKKHLFILLAIGLFMTACGPKVVSTDPAKGATDAPWYMSVSATFNQSNINPSTINASTFQVKDGSVVLDGTITVSGKTVTFLPLKDFSPLKTYTATLTKGVKNTWGFSMQSDYTWPFTTVHGWKNPKNLSDNISPDGTDISPFVDNAVAMDVHGNAIITWSQDDGINLQIFKSEYRNSVWAHPSGLSDNISPDGSNAQGPRVVMDNNDTGNAIISWGQYVGPYGQVFKCEYRNGIWSCPANLTDYISFEDMAAGYAGMAISDIGDAIIIWLEMLGYRNSPLFKAEYRNGSWTYPSNPSDKISPTGNTPEYADVAMSSNGDTIIVWDQQDASGIWQIFKSEYRNHTWTHPTSLSDNISPDGWDARLPQVAMDNNGNAIIVWHQYDGSSNVRIFKSEYRNGTWTHPSGLSDNISPYGTSAEIPDVAMDSCGNAIITWRQIDESGKLQIFKSEFRDGHWTHPSSISDHISPNGTSVSYVKVVMDASCSAIITWFQSDGIYQQAYKCEYRNGSWTCPNDPSDHISPGGSNAYGTYAPSVALDGNGNAIIVWIQYDDIGSNGNRQLFMSEYR